MAKKKNVKKAVKKTLKKILKKTSKKPVKKVAPKSTKKKALAKPAKKAAARKPAVKAKSAAKAKLKKVVPVKATLKKTAKSVLVKPQPIQITPRVLVNWNKYLTPLDDRLVVELAEQEKMTAGGLYIPNTVTDVAANLKGKVLAIGRGHLGQKGHIKNMDVQVGDQILFAEYAGSKVNVEGQNVLILRESDVLGIVTK